MSNVRVMVRADSIALVRGERVRRWILWKRWRTVVLAEASYAVPCGATVTLQTIRVADGCRYEVLVQHPDDDQPETVLSYGPYSVDDLFKQLDEQWENRR